MGPYRGIVLAAGKGTRLQPLSDSVPKAALPVLDVPLGAFALAPLLDAVAPVVVNTSHLGEQIEQGLADPQVEFVTEMPEPYGSAGTLAALRDDLAERFIVRNCDHISDLDPGAVLATHELMGLAATIAVVSVANGADFHASFGRADRLIDRRENPDAEGALYIGTAVIERSALDLIPEERPLDLTRGLLATLVDKGEVAVHYHEGYQQDVGTPERYLRGSLDVLYRHAPQPRLLGEVIEVDEGLAYVGPDSHGPKGSLRPGAIVLAGANIEEGATVENSIVWPNEVVPSGTELVGSIWALGTAHELHIDAPEAPRPPEVSGEF